MKKLFVILLLTAVLARANDCVPLTFKALSEQIGKPVSAEEWAKDLMKDGEPPFLPEAIKSWHEKFPENPLTCIYSALSDLKAENNEIEYDKSYLWIGRLPPELRKPDSTTNAHAALVVVSKNGPVFKIYHGVSTNRFFVEHLKPEEFFGRTYAVYGVKQP